MNPLEIEDIFLIPGGKGVKSFLHTEGKNGQQMLKQAVEEASFCMMVQNASAMLARTGLLFHRQVADYAYDENWKRMFMTLGLVGDILDIDIAEKIAKEIGYSWDSSSHL